MPALDLAERVAPHGLAIHVIEPYAFKLAICWAIDDAQIAEARSILEQVVSSIPNQVPAPVPA